MEPASTVAVAESSRSYFLVSTLQNTKVPVVAAQLPLTRTTLSSEDDHVAALSEGEEGDRSDAVGMSSACMLDEASVVVGSFAVDGATYAIEPGGQEAALVSLDPRMLSDSLVDGTTLVIPSAVSVDASDPYAVARIADRAFVSLKEDIQVVSVISLPSSITVIDENAFTGADDIEAIEVEANNAVYASYDGCLYTSDLSCLLLIPGGRAGAVRISSQTRSIDPAASSHCAAIDSFVVEADRSNSLLGDVEIHDANGNSIMVGFADDASGSKRSADDTELDGREEDEGAVAASIEAIAPESSGVEQVPNVDSAFEMTPEENGDASIGEGPEADPGTSGVMLETATSFRSIVAPDPEPATTGALPCIYKDAAGASHEVTAAMVAAAEGNSAIAGWSFNPSSGSLKVWSQDGATVTNLWGSDSWNDGDVPSSVYDQNYWGPLRSQVVSIDTTELSGAVNMAAWFRNMTALDDISAVRIPNGSRGTGAEGIPNSLSRMFSHSTLRSIPSTFVIPEGVSVAHCAFALTPRLTSVYEGFSLPTSCLVAVGLFEGASAIESVPGSLLKNYADSDPVELNVLFNGCTSLASIRDGFSIPSSATNIELLFGGCSSLTYLPASLSLKAFGAKRAQLAFGLDHRSHDPYQFDPKVVTYYAGDDLGELLPDIKTELPNGLSASDVATPSEYWEKCYGRTLVTSGTTVELYVRERGSDWSALPWKTLYFSDDRMEVAPAVPSFWQGDFSGWYEAVSDSGTLSGEPLSFPYMVSGPIASGKRTARLYAEYTPVAGALPCIYKDAAGASHEVTAAMVAAAEGNSAIAGWSFNPSSGSLKVWSQDGATVTNLWGSDSWNDGDVPSSVYDQNYWGPLRSQVVSIDTTELSGAVNMAAWFRNMTALDDISAVRIPNGSRGTGAEGIPNSLSRMFSHSTLRSIPSTFVIPEGVSVAHCAFALTPRLTSVYEGFSLPTSCLVAVGLFEGASAIESVPGSLLKNYADSDPVELNVLFNGCTSLASIRDGFSIPSSATNIELLFGGCSSLTYLPASLSLKAFGAKRAQLAFGLDHRSHDPYQFDPKVVTYYAGDDLGELLPDIKTELPNGLSASDVATPSEYWEKCYGRELITTGTTLELYVRDSETKEWPTIPWKTLYLPDNTLAAAPSIPSFWQTNFAGWCDSLTDEGALSGEFVAFPYTVEGEIVSGRRVAKLYAEYSAASGALPCRYRDATGVMRTITPEMIAKDEGDATIAGWSFDRTSGKLKIWSQSGATVTTLWGAGGDSPYDGDVSLDAARNGYWGPLRDLVLSIDTSELSGAERMSAWFSHMSRLIDIADLRIPDGSRGTGDDGVPCSLSRMLSRSGITSIPSSFVIPEGVISIHCAFAECGGLRSVYEGFSFPSSCTYATGAFERATRLEAVPGTLFDNISESSWINLNVLFNGCRSLSVLRDGFHIPNCAVDIEIMFGECSSLAYLPASLSLKEFGAVGASWAFGLDRRDYSDGSFRFDPPVVTYYAGDDPSTLLPDDRVLLPSGVSPSDVGDVVSYWRECYGRDLRMLGSDEVIVLTQKTGSGEVGWNQLEVVTVDADGKIDDPEVAVPFNYLFSWYADPLRKTPLEVVEGMIDVGGSSVIYGIFTPIISMDMPIPAGDASGRRNQIDLQIDRANGKVSVLGNEGKSAADIKVRSFAPVDTTLSVSSSQSLEQSGFAVELFGGNAYAVRVLLNMQGEEHRIALNHGSVNPIASLKGATSNTALEGDNIVDGTLTLDIGSGVTVAAMPEGEVGSKALTSLTWVVAAK